MRLIEGCESRAARLAGIPASLVQAFVGDDHLTVQADDQIENARLRLESDGHSGLKTMNAVRPIGTPAPEEASQVLDLRIPKGLILEHPPAVKEFLRLGFRRIRSPGLERVLGHPGGFGPDQQCLGLRSRLPSRTAFAGDEDAEAA